MNLHLHGSTDARITRAKPYHFAADAVELGAELSFADAQVADHHAWTLQLWASAEGFPDAQPAGVKVAEHTIEPRNAQMEVSFLAAAMPPAGTRPYHMALALVGRDEAGELIVGDLQEYAQPETFIQPGLDGQIRCTLADGLAALEIGQIRNPREADNLSGTLALEVWALEAPYRGGAWAGMPVASAIIGCLGGGQCWSSVQHVIPATTPAPDAVLVIMLREWTGEGYVTRDYRNLAANGEATETAPAIQDAASIVAPALAAPAEPQAARKKGDARISVNQGSVTELAGVKGISEKLARAIVAARPYASLDALCEAKGMGQKLLTKLRERLTL